MTTVEGQKSADFIVEKENGNFQGWKEKKKNLPAHLKDKFSPLRWSVLQIAVISLSANKPIS